MDNKNKPELRIIVAGSRSFEDYVLLSNTLDTIINLNKERIIRIVSGTAYGADALGEKYANEHHLPLTQIPAKWDLYGKQAGHIRNEQMARFTTINYNLGMLVAFWDGKSTGTKSMINIANRYNLEVKIIKY